MGKTRPPYPPEYREQIISLYRSGRTIASLARDFEPSEQTIRTWIKESRGDSAEAVGSPSESLPSDVHEELRRLRREVATLKMEREILEKATAWFAQKTVPK
jgi:transposase